MSTKRHAPDASTSRLSSLLNDASGPTTQRALPLFGLALVACIAWAHCLHRPAWGDETITLLTLAGHPEPNWANGWHEMYGFSSFQQIVSTLTWHDFHPPLYFWLAELWRHLTGPSLIALRCLSAIFVLASMVLAYLIATRWHMKYPALPALLFGLSGASLMYATTARQYAMVQFLILLTIYCGERKTLWTGIVAACAVATHYYAILAVAPVLAVQIVAAWKNHRRWSLSVALLFCVGVALLLPILKVQAAARMDHYPATAPLYRELSALIVGELVAGLALSSKLVLAALSSLLFAVCFFFGVRRSIAQKNLVPLIGFFAFSLFFLVLEHGPHKPLPDNFPIPYYVGFCVPTFIFLIAYGVEQLPPVSLALLPVLLLSALSWTDRGFPRSNIGPITADVHHHCDGCMIVVGAVKARGTASALLYEVRDVPVLVLAKPEDLARIDAATAAASRIYFVPTSTTPAQGSIEAQFLQHFDHPTLLPSSAYLLETHPH